MGANLGEVDWADSGASGIQPPPRDLEDMVRRCYYMLATLQQTMSGVGKRLNEHDVWHRDNVEKRLRDVEESTRQNRRLFFGAISTLGTIMTGIFLWALSHVTIH